MSFYRDREIERLKKEGKQVDTCYYCYGEGQQSQVRCIGTVVTTIKVCCHRCNGKGYLVR